MLVAPINFYFFLKSRVCVLAGSFSDSDKSEVCRLCGAGFYNPKLGSSTGDDCLVCPPGTYCPGDQNAAPEPCPSNAYCVGGSATPVLCSGLFEPADSNDVRAQAMCDWLPGRPRALTRAVARIA